MAADQFLSIKLFHLEYFLSSPLERVVHSYSQLRGRYASRVPVIRMYGTTASGRKICANIHGYFPYFFVRLPNSLVSSISDTWLRDFCDNLEKSLRSKNKIFTPDDPIVFHAQLVKARSIYGYREAEESFLKIHLLDPSLLNECQESLLKGCVMDRPFFSLETHLPYLLKFCVDHNLYGMNYMYVKHFLVRSDQVIPFEVSTWEKGCSLTSKYELTEDHLLSSAVAPRFTSTDLEIDISNSDIINREVLFQDDTDSNPGLEALWTEELCRRDSGQFGLDLPPVPSPEELLPLVRDGAIMRSESERVWLGRWTEWCETTANRFESTTNASVKETPQENEEVVDDWLQQSQTDSDQDFASSSSSANVAEPDLIRLASLAEDSDALIQLDPASQSVLQHWSLRDVHDSEEVHPDTTPPTLVDPPPSSVFMESQDSLALDNTSSMLNNAKRCLSEHAMNQRQASIDLSTELLDDSDMSEVVTVLDPVALDEDQSWLSQWQSPDNNESGLEIIEEEPSEGMDQPYGSQADVFDELDVLSPWSSPEMAGSPSQGDEFCPSQPLFDSVTEEDETASALNSQRLPQLDGTDDTSAENTSPPSKRRKRLGLRLTSRSLPQQSIMPSSSHSRMADVTQDTTFLDHSVVVLDKLTDPSSPASPPPAHSLRLSPREEFVDITCDDPQDEAIQSFQETQLTDSYLSADEHPGQLTLYSQTQLSASCDPPTPSVSTEVLPIHVPVRPQSVDFWHAAKAPPIRQLVTSWLEQKMNKPVVSLDDHSSGNNSFPQDVSGSEDAIQQKQSSGDHVSLSASVSMLYQGTSQRCFLPVQVNHTSLASLELHCRSRSPGSRSRPSSSPAPSQSIGSIGLRPDPKLDPILVACLALEGQKDIDLMILFNRNDLSTEARRVTLPRYSVKDKTCRTRHLCCRDERALLCWITYLIQNFDPDILIGYDVERYSWGYLVERANHLGRDTYNRELSRLAPDILKCPHCQRLMGHCATFSESELDHIDTAQLAHLVDAYPCECICRSTPNSPPPAVKSIGWPSGRGAGRTGGPFACPGRLVLCLWRVIMPELSLYEYSLETVVAHLFKHTVPKFSWGQLQSWLDDTTGANVWRTVDYWAYRSLANLRIVDGIDLIGRTSEFARVFGIEFFHVLSRGSQYRVESLLCRTAHRANFLLASPTVTQRARQRAPEAIPLNMEPDSQLFVDGPVAVLDFQSLYPSIMIAYNYCYSTLLGRLSELKKGINKVFDLGCLTHSLPEGLSQRLGSNVNIAPNGAVYVNASILEGILPRMVKQLLQTRLMVKNSMKLYKHDRSLARLLDARQLGLKLMANVIFGYTAANFSGRMPCVEIADSIIQKSRETLEESIDLVNSAKIDLPDSCTGLPPPTVIYGDTDSLFVYFRGYGRKEAFEAAQSIVDAITARNPAPIKLKLEKLYYPCLLEAKKRYVGYAYESVSQVEPTFDAKGIETVRRDSCPFVGKILEQTLKCLFNHFSWPDTSLIGEDAYKDLPSYRDAAFTDVRDLVRNFATCLMRNQIPFSDCILTRPYLGQDAYRPGTFAPAVQVARRLLSRDPRAEPAVQERVAYYIAPGRPTQTIISCVRAVDELSLPSLPSSANFTSRRTLAPRLNLAYYLEKQLLPPLERMTEVLGWRIHQWLSDIARSSCPSSHQEYRITRAMSNVGQSPCSLHRLGSSPFHSHTSTHKSSQRRRQSQLMRNFVRRTRAWCLACGRQITSEAQFGYCIDCLRQNERLGSVGAVSLGSELNQVGHQLAVVDRLCTACVRNRGSCSEATCLCINFHCPVHSQRLLSTMRLAQLWTNYSEDLTKLDPTLSWL